MAVIREWRSALVSAIQNGYPVTDDSVADYRAQAAKNLRLVYVAVSTDSDRNAYQLLSNELDKMQKFSNNIVAAHQDLQNISPDALKNDTLNQQILSCASREQPQLHRLGPDSQLRIDPHSLSGRGSHGLDLHGGVK